jgi:glycosyltransferase involved in cell wall biosynthesis
MRVLLVSSGSGSRGGGEIFLDYLGSALAGRGHEVLMWIPNHPRMDELAEKCARFSYVFRADYRNTYDYLGRSLSTCLNWADSRRIAREWEALRPDVIHINKQNLEDGLDLLRAVRHCGVPTVCTIHLTQTARYVRARAPWLRDHIARWFLSRYGGVFVTVQEQRCAALRDFLPKDARTKTIFNGVPLIDTAVLHSLRDAKRAELGLGKGDFLVLGVGRLVAQKRPFLFLDTAMKLHKRVPNARFLWIGDGNLVPQWKNAITRALLEGIISTTGWQANVLPYLLAGDLLLHAAEFEGLPLAVIEAMAAGLACAVTRDLASELPFFNEDNVLFIDDIEHLAEQLRNPLLLANIVRGGRRLIEDKLDLNKMAESYERLYFDEAGKSSHLAPSLAGEQLSI